MFRFKQTLIRSALLWVLTLALAVHAHADSHTVSTGSAPSARIVSNGAGGVQIVLGWNVTDTATSYNVYRGTSSLGESSTPIVANVTGTAYTDTGVTYGTSYYYLVAAVNQYGTSPMSNEAHISIGSPPTVATAPAASPSPVSGTTTALSVLGADDGGEANLTYTWSTTGTPPAPVTFSVNGTNAAKNTVATFTKAGAYNFQVVIADTGGLKTPATLAVTVSQTLATITVSPPSATVNEGATRQFTAVATDQFGAAMSSQPLFSWSVSGGGTISTSGLFTAGTVGGGPYTVNAAAVLHNGYSLVTVVGVPIVDFNLDGKQDLVLQNATSGQVALWYMNGATLAGGAYALTTPPSGWRVVSAGELNGDTHPDLVLQSGTTRQIAFWYMNGPAVTGGAYTSLTPGAGWNVVAVADMNGDGKKDIILQDSATNKVAIWTMNGTTVVTGAYTSVPPVAGWAVVGAADFNGDGKTDLVLQNAANGQIAISYMNGATVLSTSNISVATPSGWSVVAVGDYNADGKADLVLQNTTTRLVAYWTMNGLTRIGGQYVSNTPAAGWKVVGPK